MKFLAAVFLLINFLTFASCQKPTAKTENKTENNFSTKSVSDLTAKSLSKLFETLKAKKVEDVELKIDEIRVGNTRIKVTTTVEHDVFNQGRWIYAARYETKFIDDSEALFTVGSIGIGTDKNDAVETSIDEWIGLFGIALAEMLAKSNAATVDDFKVYAGLMGIRGEKPSQGWIDGSPEMNKKIISALLPFIMKSNYEINSLNLLLNVSPTGEIEGECRMNNQVSQEILAALKKLDWEKGQTDYMFKQFYLLKKQVKK